MTIAIITVYCPPQDVAAHVRDILQQVDAVYICDNSPASQEGSLALSPDVHYRWFGENLGLSRAFNQVLKDPQVGWQDDDHVLFFDQDSAIPAGHVSALLQELRALTEAGIPVGCLGPEFFNTSNGTVERPRRRKPVSDTAYGVSSVITSSMLCTYGALREVGFWNERVFLDLADWDLCWRLAEAKRPCFMTSATVLRHSLGCGEKKIGPLRLRVGMPYREYYQIRECLYLLGRRYTPFKYRIRFLATLFVRTPLHLLFLDNRKARWHYICRGFGDFFRKKTGALEQRPLQSGETL